MDRGNTAPRVLSADIGGTKTVIGMFESDPRRPRPVSVQTWSSREAMDLETLLERFLKQHPFPVSAVCLGIAGPVKAGRCKATNLPWVVSEEAIKERFGWSRVRLINDLTATALAIPLLEAEELHMLNGRREAMAGNIGVIAPGTGLGMALLVDDGGRYIPVSSEGGHADFFPPDERTIGLWRYLHQRFGHVSLERVLSGPGLIHMFSWLVDSGRYRVPQWLSAKLEAMDPAQAITEAARDQHDPLCMEVLSVFASVFGAVAGNLALTGTTTGGIYLGGGIPPRIRFKLKDNDFMASFSDKGRFKDYLEQVPVGIILNDRAALIGAAHAALSMMEEKR